MNKLFYLATVAVLVALALAGQPGIKLDFSGLKVSKLRSSSADHPGAVGLTEEVLRVSARELPVSVSSEVGVASRSRSDDELQLAVETIAAADIPFKLDTLAAKSGPDAAEMRKLLVRRWAESDPAAAAKWAMQFPEGELRKVALEQVATAWADSDLTSATAWLRDLPDGESKQVATMATAYEAGRTDPLMALELASNLSPTRERDELLTYAVSQWATDNFAAAAEWAGKISDASLRQEMLAAIAVAAAAGNAPAAATLVANTLAPGEAQARAAVAITQRWTQVAPADAAAWISQFPEIPLRTAAVENLVGLWGLNDSQAVASWVNGLPGGSLRDSALQAYAANLAPLYPAP